MSEIAVKTFDQWREVARCALVAGSDPAAIDLQDGWQSQTILPLAGNTANSFVAEMPIQKATSDFKVPRSFLKLAHYVACHRAVDRWNLLYRLLWRLTHAEPQLLEISTDDDVYLARKWERQVRRDTHKMKAFVRFRRCIQEDREWFVAWYRSDHRVVRLVAPFFADRFASMHWSILTPDESLCWDLHELRFGPGAPRSSAPNRDDLEAMWKSYYASTFNPARIKLNAMNAEMPRRYWPTLPETEIIDDLLANAPRRVAEMTKESTRCSRPASHESPVDS
jgi:probable DNA metabolism protein